MHHSDQQALFVKRWMGTTGFNPVVAMWMHKIGMSVVLANKSPFRHIHVAEYAILSGGRAIYPWCEVAKREEFAAPTSAELTA